MLITFAHPYDAKTLVVQLRPPEWHDERVVSTNVAFATAMSGQVWSKASAQTTRFRFKLREIPRISLEAFIHLLLATADNATTLYVDTDGNEWIGRFTNPEFAINTYAVGAGSPGVRYEASEISLEFEGKPLA